MRYLVESYVDANPLVSTDTVDDHLSRMAGAFALFADKFTMTLSGDASGSWRAEGIDRLAREVDEDDE